MRSCRARVLIRQRALSLPFALRYLLASRPEAITQVLGIVYRAISDLLIKKAGLNLRERGDRGGDVDSDVRGSTQR